MRPYKAYSYVLYTDLIVVGAGACVLCFGSSAFMPVLPCCFCYCV